MRYSFPIPVIWFFSATMRNVKFKSKTSPKNANFCNKTNLIFFKQKASKKATLKPINKGKFNDRKPQKRPVKKPVN